MKDRSSDFARLLLAKRQVTEFGGIFYDAKAALLKSAMREACKRELGGQHSMSNSRPALPQRA